MVVPDPGAPRTGVGRLPSGLRRGAGDCGEDLALRGTSGPGGPPAPALGCGGHALALPLRRVVQAGMGRVQLSGSVDAVRGNAARPALAGVGRLLPWLPPPHLAASNVGVLPPNRPAPDQGPSDGGGPDRQGRPTPRGG